MAQSEDDEDAKVFLGEKPANFDAEWANFQLAVRSATKKESFLRQMAGLAATITAIVGVLISVVTAVQLIQKNAKDQEEAKSKYQFDALSLYTNHWKEFGSKENCSRFTVFATTIARRAPEVGVAVSEDWQKLCGASSGETAATANFQPGVVNANSAYQTVQQVTPSILADATPPQSFAGLTVFIQYKSNKIEAAAIQTLVAGLGAKAPGIEAVANVPPRNQIRMYKEDQRPLATTIQTKLKQQLSLDFEIANLQRSYPSLPADRLEIWLKD